VLADENAALRRENERLRQLLHAHGISANAEVPFGAAAASSALSASSAAPSSRCTAPTGAGRAPARASPELAGSAAASGSSSSLRKSSIITASSTDSQTTVTASAMAAVCETAAPKLRAGALSGAKGRGGSGRKGKANGSAAAAAPASSAARAMEVDGDAAQTSALAATGADAFTPAGQHQTTPSWVGSGVGPQPHSPHASDRSGSSSSDLLFSDDDVEEEEEGDSYGEEAEGRNTCASASPESQAALAALASGALSLHTAGSDADRAPGTTRLLTPDDLEGAQAAPARCCVGVSASASAGSGGAVWDALFALPSAAASGSAVAPHLLSSAPLRLLSVASVDGLACSASAAPAAAAAGSASSSSLLAPPMPGGLLPSCLRCGPGAATAQPQRGACRAAVCRRRFRRCCGDVLAAAVWTPACNPFHECSLVRWPCVAARCCRCPRIWRSLRLRRCPRRRRPSAARCRHHRWSGRWRERLCVHLPTPGRRARPAALRQCSG
jgi:hypothetical protein